MRHHLDYESRSRVELDESGAYRYAEDESTEIIMASISDENEGPYVWINPKFETEILRSHPKAFPMLMRAFEEPDSLTYAWNAQFERALTMFKGNDTTGLNIPKPHQWRCTAAMARKAALHGGLDAACKDLGVPFVKSAEGAQLIQFFCVPRKDGKFNEPKDFPEKFLAFVNYCLDDNRAEVAIYHALKPFELKLSSLDTFLLDVTLNDRGLPVNVPACETARRIVDEYQSDKVLEFSAFTGLRPSQREAVKKLLATHGVHMADMKQPTIEKTLETMPAGTAREILEGYAELNYAAAKKVHSMLACVNSDGRVRGTLLYHGAGTGRWAGRLIQPQNYKKPSEKHKKVTGLIYQMICNGCSREDLELVFGNPMDAIASCIRHFIQDPEGDILDADYAQIECRIVCWLAGQHDALHAFASGEDQYIKMAAKIYNRPAAELLAEYKATGSSKERDLGKQAVLGCGFQMAWKKFKSTCAKYKIEISDELAQRAVAVYREEFEMVRKFWYDTDRAARYAISKPGQSFVVGKISFIVRKVAGIQFLCLTLPSKRVIVYPHPKIEITEDGDADRPSITFYGQIKDNVWGRVKTYGGKLVENATQATAADIMSHGMQNAERVGFQGLTLIHDQALARPRDRKDLKKELADFVNALRTLPEWAKGCPIDADGKIAPYYRK